jgi:Flp pilus assembly protein TadG
MPFPTAPNRKRRSAPRSRHGLVAAELAVVLPVMVILIFGTIETCAVIFLRQSLGVAAYEGARVAIVPGADEENVQAQVLEILAQRNIQNATIEIAPNDVDAQPPLTLIQVNVTASVADNCFFANFFFGSTVVGGQATMMTE